VPRDQRVDPEFLDRTFKLIIYSKRGQDSSTGIETGCTTGVRFWGEDSSLFHSAVHLGFHTMDTGAISVGLKWPRLEADHSNASSVNVKNYSDITAPRICIHSTVLN
jgi:hypothetical protein